MEDNLENKAKFFAQYWGQMVLSDGIEIGGCVGDCETDMFLEIKPLSSITDEDAKGMLSFAWGSVERIKQYYSFDIVGIELFLKDLKPIDYDYLRSKGYALPYMGLSIEELIERSWIKLKV